MLFLLTAALAVFRAQAAPFSAGPATVPTVIHTVLSGIQPRADGSGADLRNLGEVVWSCLLTIFACVYQAVHPDVPDVDDVDKFAKRVVGTVLALGAPEFIIYYAIRQRSGAKIVADRVNEVVPSLGWEETQGHFAQMGGFASREDKEKLLPATLIQLLKDGRLDIEELESVKKKDILDKSKGDWLAKGLVALQTTWFVLECLARLQQKLPLLELEVATLAFATLNVFTYILWWSKPLNVDRPIFLRVLPSTTTTCSDPSSGDPSEPAPNRVLSFHPSQDVGLLEEKPVSLEEALPQFVGQEEAQNTAVLSFVPMPPRDTLPLRELACLIALIFAGIHFLSWYSTFPTRAELILWRISCIAIAVTPGLMLLASLSFRIYETVSSRMYSHDRLKTYFNFCDTLIILSGFPYTLGRIFLVILSFVALRRLPPGALTNVSWTSYIPHL
ncbi:hypothetical protein BDN72DRAFT_813950 [Pluteus cervinus]|uniref:Uncharacterized protein n=1 Tax=Pluteus cervinus TaxID=181527 RepID=A0ACD3B6S0_9AGAR|nr:hypothetical protein BDN72DRAFT_813950 [Pluteus cervinus]